MLKYTVDLNCKKETREGRNKKEGPDEVKDINDAKAREITDHTDKELKVNEVNKINMVHIEGISVERRKNKILTRVEENRKDEVEERDQEKMIVIKRGG